MSWREFESGSVSVGLGWNLFGWISGLGALLLCEKEVSWGKVVKKDSSGTNSKPSDLSASMAARRAARETSPALFGIVRNSGEAASSC